MEIANKNKCNDGIMLFFLSFQRAGVRCKPAVKRKRSLIPEQSRPTFSFCVSGYGRPVIMAKDLLES